MPNIIKMGTIPEQKPPWWESTTLTCPHCGTAFLLTEDDFTLHAWVERRDRTPGGMHTVEGNCPLCEAPLLIDIGRATNQFHAAYERQNAVENRTAQLLANYQGEHIKPEEYEGHLGGGGGE